MKSNLFIRLLCSIPAILIFIYFIPFLGICLLLLRCFIYNNKKRILTPIILIGVAILILIPKGFYYVFDTMKLNINDIPYYKDIIGSDLYNINFLNYSKTLFTVGIIYLIMFTTLTAIFNKVSNKVSSGIRDYINETERKNAEMYQKNDLIMKEKREKAKNTHVVHCLFCGSDNIITEQTGTCKFCRRKIEYKK